MFRAGDKVKHRPSGETWVLAVDEEFDRVSWVGWPEGMADASDCELVEAATDEQRLARLQTSAEVRGGDHRASAALRQLAAAKP